MKKLYCTHNTAPFVPNGQYCQLQGGAAMIIKIWEYKPQYNRDLGCQVFFSVFTTYKCFDKKRS